MTNRADTIASLAGYPVFDTPILLVGFNRPETTERVFEAIRSVRPTRLYFAVDGPRTDRHDDEAKCAAVQALAKRVDWDCDLQTFFRQENVGCRDGVAGAIDWLFANETSGIILEDDCLPTHLFFEFCAELLRRYENDLNVAQISGSCFAPNSPASSSYYFTKYADIWGWATWRRSWQNRDLLMASWPKWRDEGGLAKMSGSTVGFESYWTEKFDLVFSKGTRTIWDYQWMYTCWSRNMVSIQPKVPLIENIGFGPDATHHIHEYIPSYVRSPAILEMPLVAPKTTQPDPSLERAISSYRYGINGLTSARALAKRIPIIGIPAIKAAKNVRNLIRRLYHSPGGSKTDD